MATPSPVCPPACPHCGSDKRQAKAGRTPFGSLRLHCHTCDKDYTPQPQKQGYPGAVRQEAVRLYVEGLSFRRIARVLSVNHQSVVNWVTAHQNALQNAGETTLPPGSLTACAVVELDELHTFIGQKRDKELPTGEKNREDGCTLPRR